MFCLATLHTVARTSDKYGDVLYHFLIIHCEHQESQPVLNPFNTRTPILRPIASCDISFSYYKKLKTISSTYQ